MSQQQRGGQQQRSQQQTRQQPAPNLTTFLTTLFAALWARGSGVAPSGVTTTAASTPPTFQTTTAPAQTFQTRTFTGIPTQTKPATTPIDRKVIEKEATKQPTQKIDIEQAIKKFKEIKPIASPLTAAASTPPVKMPETPTTTKRTQPLMTPLTQPTQQKTKPTPQPVRQTTTFVADTLTRQPVDISQFQARSFEDFDIPYLTPQSRLTPRGRTELNLFLQRQQMGEGDFGPQGGGFGGGTGGFAPFGIGGSSVIAHTIKPGETLSKIARDYNTTIEEILRFNKENTTAIKSPNLIISGETIFVPIRQQKETKTEPSIDLLAQRLPTVEDINQKARELLSRRTEVKAPTLDTIRNFVNLLFMNQLSELEEKANRYFELSRPETYQETYQRLIEESGLPALYQRQFELQSILGKTREDVLREAAFSGGIVTESMVEEIVSFRQSMIKNELSSLVDLIESKERLVDRLMKYVDMDRDLLEKRIEKMLDLDKQILKLKKEMIDWNLDQIKETSLQNQRKLNFLVQSGALADYTDEMLLKMANPDDLLYTGFSIEELLALRESARFERQLKQERLINQMRRMEMAKERLEMQKERLRIQQQGKTQRTTPSSSAITSPFSKKQLAEIKKFGFNETQALEMLRWLRMGKTFSEIKREWQKVGWKESSLRTLYNIVIQNKPKREEDIEAQIRNLIKNIPAK